MKKVAIILFVLALICIGAYLFVRNKLSTGKFSAVPPPDSSVATAPAETLLDLKPRIIKKLQQVVKEGSNGLYNLYIHEIDPDIFDKSVKLRKILLAPDTPALKRLDSLKLAPDNVFRISADSILIDGIGLQDVMNKKDIDLKKLYLLSPVIDIYTDKKPYNEKRIADTVTFFQRLAKQLNHVSVDTIIVRDATLVTHNSRKKINNKFNQIQIALSNILVDSSTQYDKDRFFFAKEADISTSNYSIVSKDKLYEMKLGLVRIKAPAQTLSVSNISFKPRVGKEDFVKAVKIRKERYDISVSGIQFKNMDWWSLVNEETLIADEADLNGGFLGIYLDRSRPVGKPKGKTFPSQLVKALPLELSVKKLNVRNFDLQYEEYNPVSDRVGKVTVKNANGSIINFANRSEDIKKHRYMVIEGKGSFLGGIPAEMKLQFDMLKQESGAFTADVKINSFEPAIIQPVTEALGMFRLKSGKFNSLTSHVFGNDKQASGKVLALYEDIAVSALERDNKNPDSLELKHVTSLLINTIVLKKNNPSGSNPPRQETGSYARDPYASFFNLLWKTTLVGILKTVGAPERLAKPKESKK